MAANKGRKKISIGKTCVGNSRGILPIDRPSGCLANIRKWMCKGHPGHWAGRMPQGTTFCTDTIKSDQKVVFFSHAPFLTAECSVARTGQSPGMWAGMQLSELCWSDTAFAHPDFFFLPQFIPFAIPLQMHGGIRNPLPRTREEQMVAH